MPRLVVLDHLIKRFDRQPVLLETQVQVTEQHLSLGHNRGVGVTRQQNLDRSDRLFVLQIFLFGVLFTLGAFDVRPGNLEQHLVKVLRAVIDALIRIDARLDIARLVIDTPSRQVR